MTPRLAHAMLNNEVPFTGNLVKTKESCMPDQMLALSRAALELLEARPDGDWLHFADGTCTMASLGMQKPSRERRFANGTNR